MAPRLQLSPTPEQRNHTPENLVIETDIPARLDRLPWGSFHTLVAAGLGVTWILNGLEVTLASALAPVLRNSLGLTTAQVGFVQTAYVAGLPIRLMQAALH